MLINIIASKLPLAIKCRAINISLISFVLFVIPMQATLANSQSAKEINVKEVICPITSLNSLLRINDDKFRLHTESLSGYSSEGGLLTIFFQKNEVRRIRVDLFGETGKTSIKLGRLDKDIIAVIEWTDYQEMLPKIPSQTKSFEKEVGYLCSGNLTLDHNHTGHHRDEEFKELMKWVLDELKLRGVEFQK